MNKLTSTLCMLLVTLSLVGQRMEVPESNPDNGLDLKIVFQEYTVTTSHGNGAVTSQKGKYPLLKVNGVYLPGGYTGINKTDFNSYLGSCPKALDIGLDGLKSYKKARLSKRISNIVGFGAMAVGGITSLGDNRTLGATIFGGGLATWLGFGFNAKRLDKRGNNQVVDAFGHYGESCYDASKNTFDYVEDEDVEHGDTNEGDKVLIDVLTNNAKTYLLAAGVSGTMAFLEDGLVGYGAGALMYKRGLYADVAAHKIRSIGTFSEDTDALSSANEYFLSATVGVPIFSRVKKGKLPLTLGKVQGFLSAGVLDDVGVGTALSVRAGINRYRQINYSSFDDFKQYASTSTLVRAGISWSGNTELSFGVDDNRYTESVRFALSNAMFYVDAVYNLSTEYEVIEPNDPFGIGLDGTEDPSHRDIGIAVGIQARQTGDGRFLAKSIKLEFGYMPINNAATGAYGMCTFGFDLYKVNRKKL